MGAKSETGKKFTKVYQKTIFSQIAKQILNAIQNGEYKPGDKLPSERSIAEQMGVSRNAVREALKSLQILGVILPFLTRAIAHSRLSKLERHLKWVLSIKLLLASRKAMCERCAEV